MHRSLEWMRINPIQDVIFEHFTVEIPGAEVDQVMELVPGGKGIQVTDDNKEEFIRVKSMWYLQNAFEEQLRHFCQGFWEVIPQCDRLMTIFEATELDILLSGQHELVSMSGRRIPSTLVTTQKTAL